MNARLLALLDHHLNLTNRSVAEPGCGDGRYTRELAARARVVYASDARIENLAKACRACQGLENVHLVHIEAEGGGLPSADVCFHVGLLYHLVNPLAHLATLARTYPILFLDTHYTVAPNGTETFGGKTYRVQAYSEDPSHPRSGLHPIAQWLQKKDILSVLRTGYPNPQVVWSRMERNGPRATIVAVRAT